MTDMVAAYSPLAFESEVTGRPFGKLTFAADSDAPDLAAMAKGWRRDQVFLVVARIPESWSGAAKALTNAGFRRIETLVTFQRAVPTSAPTSGECALIGPDDVDDCLAIAKRAFHLDRLHADPLVPNDLADLVRRQWICNDINGRAAFPLCIHDGGQVAGFNLGLLKDGLASIDLIAVDPEFQGRGLGLRLIDGLLSRLAGKAERLLVGTQHNNAGSIGLYRKSGFVEARRDVTFHWVNPQGTLS